MKTQVGKHRTSNNQRPTSIGGAKSHRWLFDVGCWMLDVLAGLTRPILLVAVLFACFCTVSPLRAADAAANFDHANHLYEEGKFRESAGAYSNLVATGTVSPALYFNLGNALFKSGQVGEAIAAYRQAERLAPRDPDLRANLEFARRQVSGPTLHDGWLQRQMAALTTNEWTLLAVVPVWAWFGLMIAPRLKPAWKPSLRGAKLATGLAALLTCGALGLVLQRRLDERTVIVTERNTVVRYGPFAESQSAFTAADGAELRVTDKKDDWFQVSDNAKSIGWIKTNAAVVLKN
jgi:tetratricopeptide (TPR) repeat protein